MGGAAYSIIPFVYDSFDPAKIDLVFYDISRLSKTTSSTIHFVLKNQTDRMIEFYYYRNEKIWQFIIDEYEYKTVKRKKYITTMPYKTYEDFEYDLERIGVTLFVDEQAV